MTISLNDARVLPVITPRDTNTTLRLTKALTAGGMQAVEITLRRSSALECIRAVKSELPGLLVAAGTVTNPGELEASMAAGADFCVSPGLTPALLAASRDSGGELLPGVATPSEVMLGRDYGLNTFKLFPAVAVGGIQLLKSLAGPFPDISFCPTGGLNPGNYREFLALDNVVCCGGSWMVAEDLIDQGRWDDIEELAREAVS